MTKKKNCEITNGGSEKGTCLSLIGYKKTNDGAHEKNLPDYS